MHAARRLRPRTGCSLEQLRTRRRRSVRLCLHSCCVARRATHAPLLCAARHPHVGMLPFYNLTKPRYDLHEGGFCAFEGLRGKKPDDPPPYCWCATSPLALPRSGPPRLSHVGAQRLHPLLLHTTAVEDLLPRRVCCAREGSCQSLMIVLRACTFLVLGSDDVAGETTSTEKTKRLRAQLAAAVGGSCVRTAILQRGA